MNKDYFANDLSIKTPNFYTIIPANVRYDKDLKPLEKLLFGEIARLSVKEGYCTATNNYLASLYDLTPNYVSNSISNLAKRGYIRVEVLNKNERRIYMPLYALPPEILKFDYATIIEAVKKALSLINNDTAVVVKNATTESSSKRPKTNEEICPFFEELWKMYPQKLGKNRVSKKSLAEINKIGFDKMKEAIDNFNTFHKMRGTERRFLPYGSSFFNGVYKDFLNGVPNTMPEVPDDYAFFGRTV